MKTTTTTVAGTTSAEAEVLAATAAAIAAGEDPFGDDGEDDVPTAAAAAAAAAADDDGDEKGAADDKGDEAKPADEAKGNEDDADGAGKGDDGKGVEEDDDLSAEALAAIAADDEQPTQAAPRYKVDDLADLKTKRTEQLTIKAKALKDLMDGVIEPEEYSRIEGEVTEALEGLAAQRTLHEANVQTEQQSQESALDKIIADAKKAGEVDYRGDAKAARQFDTAMAMLSQDGETRTYAELAAEAHKAVLAIRGIKKAEPAPAPTPAQPRENGKGPMTLRNVPAAETPNSGGGWKEQLATLSGQAYEDAFARLSPGQKAELLND